MAGTLRYFAQLVLMGSVAAGAAACADSTSGSSEGSGLAKGDRATKKITCSLARLAAIPPGAETVTATVESKEGETASSESLGAYKGSYNFSMEVMEGGMVGVWLYENNIVQDEVGSLDCDPAQADAEGVFCREPIELDKSLGVENAKEEMVNAFDFSCRIGG